MHTQNDLALRSFSVAGLGETITRLIKQKNINLVTLCKNTGIPIGTLSRIISDKNANPTLSSLKPIARFFNVSIGQLIGEEPLTLDDAMGYVIENRNFWTTVPLIPWDKVSAFLAKNSSFDQGSILTDIDLKKNAFALMVQDHDWNYFSKNTILIIDPLEQGEKPKNRDFIVVCKKNQCHATLKQLLIDDEGDQYLKPMNDTFKINSLDTSYEIYGVMKQARKDYL